MIRVKLSFLFLILSACVYAQEVINIDTTFNFKCTEVLKPVNNNNYRNLIKHSYNYGYAQLEVFNKAVYYFTYLFPDTALFAFGNSYDRNEMYKIATIIDPKADFFKNVVDPDFSANLGYNVDTIVFPYRYHRTTSDAIVDTLFLEIASDSNLATSYLAGQSIVNNYSVNSIACKDLKFVAHSSTIGELNLIKRKTIGILLDKDFVTDQAQGDLLLMSAVPGVGKYFGGENIVITAYFKPGYSYTLSDTINKMGNTFQLIQYEEQGLNTFPIYHDKEFNCSYVANYINTANPLTNSWYQKYIPMWAWGQGSADHFDFEAKISYDEIWLGIESDQNEAINVGQSFPNPSSGVATFSYKVNRTEAIQLNIFNVTGQNVYSENQGIQTTGQHFITANLNHLQAGVYFYSINGSTLKKMIVQ